MRPWSPHPPLLLCPQRPSSAQPKYKCHDWYCLRHVWPWCYLQGIQQNKVDGKRWMETTTRLEKNQRKTQKRNPMYLLGGSIIPWSVFRLWAVSRSWFIFTLLNTLLRTIQADGFGKTIGLWSFFSGIAYLCLIVKDVYMETPDMKTDGYIIMLLFMWYLHQMIQYQ